MPCQRSWRKTTSMIGTSPIGASGLGNTVVNGSSRRPRPPARITARTGRSDRILVGSVAAQVCLDPLDGPAQALIQGDSRLPVGQGSEFGGVADETVDLAAGRPHALRLGLDHQVTPEQGPDPG